jgi:tRNA(Ile)-lysidine synthase
MAVAPFGKPAPHSASSTVSPEDAALDFLKSLKTPARVLVAYSGGGDSTGLLVALASALKDHPAFDVTLIAATVDHGLRPGSRAEAERAGALAEWLSIPHHTLAWEGEKPATGIQAAARTARYGLLKDLALSLDADLIVTAHNLDDQVETLAMRQARNPEAVTGMSDAVLIERRIWALRPFLGVRRAAIRDYLTQCGIGWIDDPSNDNEAFERVRVRKSLDPSGAVADFAALREARRALAEEAAAFLMEHVVIHSARVAMLDLSGYQPETPAHLQAVLHLLAFTGGRTHIAGRDAAQRISTFLAERRQSRLTAERVVLDRRGDRLFMTREKRSLPSAIIQPGSSVLWDHRFHIENRGTDAVMVSSRGGDGRGMPLIADTLPEDLPKSVRQCALATEPVLPEGEIGMLAVEPIPANFVHFLPRDLLAIGNALAILNGLDHFPALPTR